MHMFAVGLLAASALSYTGGEPSEDAMREAFAADLSQGVKSVLGWVAEAGGEAALARIREAQTGAFEVRGFRKGECRQNEIGPGHICVFAIEIDTVAGPIEASIAGRFYLGPC